jgi:hypothetical protein
MKKITLVEYLLIFTKYLFIPILNIIVFLFGYQALTIQYGGVGYGGIAYDWGKTGFSGFLLEFFLVIIFYYTLFFVLKNNRYRHILAILPIVIFYLFYDYYFILFGRVFKLCDLSEIPELIDVLPFWQTALYITLLLHIIFILAINFSKSWKSYIFPIFILLTVTFSVRVYPAWYLDKIFKPVVAFEASPWSDQNTAQNGYFTTLLYFEAMMIQQQALAAEVYGYVVEYEKSQTQLSQFLKEKNNSRNIHVIVLESFFNPKLLTKVNYSDSVYAKEFSTLLNGHESAVISPVFGGGTAQAEFEVLCGVPALHKYNSIEFNSFTGASVYCIPTLLKAIGYRVVASNSYKPNFFNAVNAYKGVGFGETYFPQQYAPQSNTYLSLVDKEKYIFDGDLFEQNLDFVKDHINAKDHKPLFNYMLGMYGHMPFTMDEKRHPLHLKAMVNTKPLNDEYQRATNQIFYRSQALAVYLDKLIKLDPNSLIIVLGDHLPELGGTEFYKKMGFRNNDEDNVHKPSAFYIINGQFVKKEETHQYDLMMLMLDYLTDNKYCKTYPCQRPRETLEYQYNMDMARSLK